MICEVLYYTESGGTSGKCNARAVYRVHYDSFAGERTKLVCKECADDFEYLHEENMYEVLKKELLNPNLEPFE